MVSGCSFDSEERRWEEHLIRMRVISSRQASHGVILSLLPPYDSPATALKDDVVELKLKSDPKTRNMLKMALGSNYMVLLPLIADLAQRVERLEGKGGTILGNFLLNVITFIYLLFLYVLYAIVLLLYKL